MKLKDYQKLHPVELEQMEDQSKVILENEIIPENFMRYTDFLDALDGNHEKASKMWMDMIDKRDKWVEV